MIDLNQAEILANRLREKHDWWGGVDWNRICQEKAEMEAMFPDLVSELKESRERIRYLEDSIRDYVKVMPRTDNYPRIWRDL